MTEKERERQAGGEEWVENVGGGAGNEGSKGDRKQMVQMGLRCLMNSRRKEKLRTGYFEKCSELADQTLLGPAWV